MMSSPAAEPRYDPDHAVPPGATLRSTLAALPMTQTDLATRAGLSLKHINQIMQGIAPISQETALVFDKVTGVPARVWNRLEANYRERLARAEDRRALSLNASWLDSLPTKELVRQGVLTKGADKATQLQEACRFFGVANPESWERVWREPLARFRKSQAFKSDAGAVATWLRLGELKAARIACAPFDPAKFRRVLDRIRLLTPEAPEDFQPELAALCADAGVAVVFVPEIKGTRSSGAARWLTPTRGLIQLSLRHKSDDHLWFSFFHEAAHLLLHSKKATFVTGTAADDVAEEEADLFAASFLIPRRYEGELRTLANTTEITSFAQRLGIAPGIVVGRMQKEEILDWNQGNHLKKRFRFVDE